MFWFIQVTEEYSYLEVRKRYYFMNSEVVAADITWEKGDFLNKESTMEIHWGLNLSGHSMLYL